MKGCCLILVVSVLSLSKVTLAKHKKLADLSQGHHFDNQPSVAAHLTKNIPPPLRRAIVLTLEKSDVGPFVAACIKKALCSHEQVLNGIGGKRWKWRIKHQRSLMHFWQVYECYAHHRPMACPVDGGWSAWGAWEHCSARCGRGTRVRRRKCISPQPANYGKQCAGKSVDKEHCEHTCPKNFTAMVEGDPLKQQALSTMHSIESQNTGLRDACHRDHCTYHEVHELIPDQEAADQYWLSMHCVERYIGCPINGGWSEWEAWSNCTTDCGIGERFRVRRCSDPPPANGGAYCPGDAFEREDCLGVDCPGVSGAQQAVWTEWSDWSKCSARDCVTYGTEISRRLCIGVHRPAVCDVGDGSVKGMLERRRPCVREGCFQTTTVSPGERPR
ncbi:semaphorin-5A-like [Paramacrobiotus metropolitanus]|uniref:semaphorin-5A-like n=1 Tax=Paramacrobiotus metropolitanus TaxID=2943436 RepID=UPI002445F3D2|nr:semaphorin-5A-like [Paramacrobiotus metropolitanus]